MAILVIDDEENLRLTIAERLERAGHAVQSCESIDDAESLVRAHDFDLVITDVCLGTDSGIDFVRRIREEGFDGAVVVMTAFGTIDTAVSAMKYGADDFVQKPLALRELPIQVDRWLEQRRLARRLELYERQERALRPSEQVIGRSDAWQRTLTLAQRLAGVPIGDRTGIRRTGLPAILLLGETGTGKGVLARHIHDTAIHGHDEKTPPPFVQVNCAALPATLIESELFGHERGAFTDAREAKAGLFEMADGGTIFLDEIGEMPAELQAKLLLVVEQGTYRRVGGSKERHVRARIIAATNQDLQKRVSDRAFREDLLYRLNTFTVRVPPLRERENDSGMIADALLQSIGRQYGRTDLDLTPAARNAVKGHRWPGNVRELLNCIQRAVMLADTDSITVADLALNSTEIAKCPAEPGSILFDFDSAAYTVDQVERSLVMQALEHTRGNITRAAKLLSMQRSSLRYRIERLGLSTHVQELNSQ